MSVLPVLVSVAQKNFKNLFAEFVVSSWPDPQAAGPPHPLKIDRPDIPKLPRIQDSCVHNQPESYMLRCNMDKKHRDF